MDDGEVAGRVGSDVPAWFLRVISREDIWPYTQHVAGWEADTLFDVREVLHDVISKPVDGRYHDFGGCGWHYSRFDRETGRTEYRQALKQLIERYEEPLNSGGARSSISPLRSSLRS